MPLLIRAASAPLRRSTLLLATTLTMVAMPMHAQSPARWIARPDGGGDARQVTLTTMPPGFHVTTGPATILIDTTMRARGDWRLEATIHLFDPGARAEGFGVFFGGRDLGGTSPTYAYALVRRDGRALLKVREGATTRTVRDWTANGAIPTWRAGPAGSSVKYPLVVEARGNRVTLWVGATQVLDAARTELPTDGAVGLRINHALNLHIESITVKPLSTSR